MDNLRKFAEGIIETLDELEQLREENELRKQVMLEHGCPLNIDVKDEY